MRRLGHAVTEAFAAPHGTTGLLLDQILNAACVHVLGQYGDTGMAVRRASGGLAPWQERRAKAMMNDCANVSLTELAQECGLSATHFVRAFRQTTGTSPHQWLLTRRIDRATSLLAGTSLTLAEIALTCGFSSQSHLTAAFTASVGVSPGRFRRALPDDRPS